MKFCPKCQIDVREDAKFCPNCGGALVEKETTKFCGHCGAKVTAEMKCCPQCGASLVPGFNTSRQGPPKPPLVQPPHHLILRPRQLTPLPLGMASSCFLQHHSLKDW